MIKTSKDLHKLASIIFDNNINNIYINEVLAESEDYICLLKRLKAGREVLTGIVQTYNTLYLWTV